MTLSELYLKGKQSLTKAGLESPAFDALSLFTRVTGLTRHALTLRGREQASDAQATDFLALIARRAAREPLQYILGSWAFMDMEFAVGEGVLVPREDTQVLVEEGARLLALCGDTAPVVYDLCGGTGAAAIGLQRLVPQAEVYCFELSGAAFPYLIKNIARLAPGVHAVRWDVLQGLPADLPAPVLILSNPPYISSGDIGGLSPEVRREPRAALDGGADGLTFYRAIAGKWCPLLPQGGYAAVEIGIAQTEPVRRIFEEAGLLIQGVVRDWGGVERVVTARKTR